MRKKLCVAALFIAALAIFAANLHATDAADPGNKDRVVTVMTRNLDAGSDFGFVLKAALDPNVTPIELLFAISTTYQEMLLSDIPLRAQAIAAEVKTSQPDLIALQEITTLRVGPPNAPADTVVVDGLNSLLQALNAQGLHYKQVAVQQNASIDLPAVDGSFNFITAGFTDYDALLARTDLQVADLKISNVAMDHFHYILPSTVGGQTIPFTRGWISMQVKVRGKEYKFVTTHLETFNSDIQAAQTEELLAGPLVSDRPVILAGDLNSDAANPSWANGPAITILGAAGFEDVWAHLQPASPGLTWPLYAEDPPGPATPYQRIDLILTRGGGLVDKNVVETGLTPWNGILGSDHAGVVGSFILLP
jgi:endonuclease/exonuclease/phosphatase family metal-dependent hydrolase